MSYCPIATGAGKTLITAALSERVEKYGRSIVIVPNKDLVKQTFDDYKNLGLDVGVYYSDKKKHRAHPYNMHIAKFKQY